ncbi:glycosyltransferase family 9 protein [Candidatus Woesearchaeota archaeon]|nr:glycosyltransferase family 9 protein [Candidatus Woesearchaeota archaeon]
MKLDTMRMIDYWIGIPICFLLSVTYKIKKILRLTRKPLKNPQKIMFIELSEMGSTVIAYGAMKKAKELFPAAQLYFLIFEENKQSVQLLNMIPKNNILTIRSKKFLKLTIDTFKLLLHFRKEKIDIAIDLELFSRFSAILNYLSCASKRAGFYKFNSEGLYRGTLLTHQVTYNSHLHISLNFLALVYSLIAQKDQQPFLKQHIGNQPLQELPSVDFGQQAKNLIKTKLADINPDIKNAKKIILLNPNAGYLPLRAWPLENYIKLTQKLLQNENYFVIIMGVKLSIKDANTITQTINNSRCINFAGKTTFEEMMTLFNISDLLITNDSGPAHFASLTPIKIAVFFGPETPTLYAPLSPNKIIFYSNYACSPCLSAFNHRKTSCTDNQCLKTISVETVYSAVMKFLTNDTASVT